MREISLKTPDKVYKADRESKSKLTISKKSEVWEFWDSSRENKIFCQNPSVAFYTIGPAKNSYGIFETFIFEVVLAHTVFYEF